MSKEKRFVIQVDPLEIEDDSIFDNKELRLYECQSDMMSDICSLLNKQDQRIAELEEQLKDCIKPKFKIGQEVYVVRNNKILREKIANIGIWQVSNNYDMQLDWEYRTEQCMAVYVEENEIFATKEEAQAKLENIKNV